jgi:hypothetical protein
MNPIRRRRRRANPISGRGIKGIVNRTVMPALTAAGGAVALDVVWSYLPIPAMFRTGYLQYPVKLGGAIALGWLASKVVKKSTADTMVLGMATVIAYNAMRALVAQFAPGVQMANTDMGYYPSMGYYSAAEPAGTLGYYPNQPVMTPDMTDTEMGYYANRY